MKTDFLKSMGLTDDQISQIMAENGKDISREQAKADGTKAELEKLKADAEAQAIKLKELETAASDAEKVKAELTAMRLENEKREADAKAKTEDDTLTAKVIDVIGDSKFVNDITRDGIVKAVKEAHRADTTKGLKEVFEGLTKDKEGIFVNPNAFKPNMGGIGNLDTKATEIKTQYANAAKSRNMAEMARLTRVAAEQKINITEV